MKKTILLLLSYFCVGLLQAQQNVPGPAVAIFKEVAVGKPFANVKQKNWELQSAANGTNMYLYKGKNEIENIPGFTNAFCKVLVNEKGTIQKWEAKQVFTQANEAVALDVWNNVQTHFSKILGAIEVNQPNELVWYGNGLLLGVQREKNAQGFWELTCYSASLALY